VHRHPPASLDGSADDSAESPNHFFTPAYHRSFEAARRKASDRKQQYRTGERETDDQPHRNTETRCLRVHQEQPADNEGNDAADPEHPEAWNEGFCQHESCPDCQQQNAGPIHRQQLEGIKCNQQRDGPGYPGHTEAG